MKFAFIYLISSLLFISPKVEDNTQINNKSKSLCSAVVESIANYNGSCTVISINITGCGTTGTNTINLTSGTASSLNQPTCANKFVKIKIQDEFNTVKMYDGMGNILQTQVYNQDLYYEFNTPGCGLVHFVVE